MKHAIRENRYGNWAAYTGGRHVCYFYASHLAGSGRGAGDQRAQAEQWLRERNAAQVEADHGAQLTSLWLGHSRTQLTVDTTDADYAAALVRAAETRLLPVRTDIVDKGRAKRVPHLRVTLTARTYDIAVEQSYAPHALVLRGLTEEGQQWLQAGKLTSAAVWRDELARIIADAVQDGMRVRTL
jgi:hypothetical protein